MEDWYTLECILCVFAPLRETKQSAGGFQLRSKIIIRTDLSLQEIQTFLDEHHWTTDQESETARVIKDEMLDAVALDHKEDAIRNFKFVVYDYSTDAAGILCHDKDTATIRLKNKDVLSLQVSTQHLVELLKTFSHQKNKRLEFETINILEKRVRRPLLEGHVLDSKKARLTYARKEKSVEYGIAKFAAGLALFLLVASFFKTVFPPAILKNPNYGAQLQWTFEILEKLIGSSMMTAIISYLSYHAFMKSLEDTFIRWQVPKVQDTFK